VEGSEVAVPGALLVRHEAASAALVRRSLARDLAGYDLPADAVDDAVLVASELVGNAVRHAPVSASGTLGVDWYVDADGIRVSVSDASTDQPDPRVAGEDQTCGRGLTIVSAMSDDWGVERSAAGKRVWAHVPARRPGAGSD
jgi:anti-sigma regulatory factor (Ser/Thr protein kinase)